MEGTVHGQRPSIFSRSSRAAKKSSLKRSKSLHCSPQQQSPTVPPHSAGLVRTRQTNRSPYYADRRHHTDGSNDYCDPSDEGSAFPFMLNSSSHNLYYQFQNGQQPNGGPQQRGSCSSGTSLASLSESVHTNSRKPSDYYEDVFYEANPTPSLVSGQLCAKMGALSLSDSNGHHHTNTSSMQQKASANSPLRRYVGSSSNSSLCNNGNTADLNAFLDALDADNRMTNEYSEPDDNVWDDFTLEPLQETTRFDKPTGHTKKGSSSHGSNTADHFRFYMIKQRNYPPLYLETQRNRRRIYRILVLGYPSCGKSSLIEQFGVLLAQNENARFNPALSTELDSHTNLLIHLLESDSFDKYLLQMPVTDYQPDVYLILYSINNRDSFNSVKKTLIDLQRWDDVENKSIIIVANKSDLVRGRCVTRREGRELASSNNCKYIEISCTISHNIDVLLQGIGSQICLKEQEQNKQKELDMSESSRARLKRKPSFFRRILRKTAINKSKSCDNLHVL